MDKADDKDGIGHAEKDAGRITIKQKELLACFGRQDRSMTMLVFQPGSGLSKKELVAQAPGAGEP